MPRSFALPPILKPAFSARSLTAAGAATTSRENLEHGISTQGKQLSDEDFDALRRRRKTEWKRKQGVSATQSCLFYDVDSVFFRDKAF